MHQPLIQSITFDGKKYLLNGVPRGGLHKKLKGMYYPNFQRKKNKQKRGGLRGRKGSTRLKGIKIGKELQEYVSKGKKPKNDETKALVAYFENELHHNLQGAEVPVYVRCLNVITGCDLITEDPLKQLWAWEIKSGYNQVVKQGCFLEDVPNNLKNQWELQNRYTHKGLVSEGLPIFASHVVNVYREKGSITVKKRKVPSWVLEKIKLK